MYQQPNAHIHTFRKPLSFIWGCFFHVSFFPSFLKTVSRDINSELYVFTD